MGLIFRGAQFKIRYLLKRIKSSRVLHTPQLRTGPFENLVTYLGIRGTGVRSEPFLWNLPNKFSFEEIGYLVLRKSVSYPLRKVQICFCI